jgi:hypothetical protein
MMEELKAKEQELLRRFEILDVIHVPAPKPKRSKAMQQERNSA